MFVLCVNNQAFSQRTAGWLFLSHKHQLNHIWGYAADLQLRTEEPFSSLQTVLVRTWVNYAVSDHSSIGLGYVHFGNWQQQADSKFYRPENRIFEEFKTKTALGNFNINHRFRLEQRFFAKENRAEFAQRLRYQFGFSIPLPFLRISDRPTKIIVQDELFLNLQNKKALNKCFFDQNRPYIGWEISCSDALGVELGYYYRTQQTLEGVKNWNIVQLKLNTDF